MKNPIYSLCSVLLVCCLFATPALATLDDVVVEEQVVTVALDGYSISGLVTRLPNTRTFRYGIIQFPGYPSIMRLRLEDGQPVFELKGNSLVRGRKLWLDEETLVLTVDAPDDHWGNFDHWFRRGSRYGQDVAALISAVRKQYAVAEWVFVGHSEGTISAYGAARVHPASTRRLVQISSLTATTKNGPGISGLDWDIFSGQLLWVHHADDPCRHTPYDAVQGLAHKHNNPLMTMHGGDNTGDPCRAQSFHGFPGLEATVFSAIKDWVKSGKAASDVGP